MSHAERVVHIDTSQVRVTEWRLRPGASTSPNAPVPVLPYHRDRRFVKGTES
jgi:hypothetical protein